MQVGQGSKRRRARVSRIREMPGYRPGDPMHSSGAADSRTMVLVRPASTRLERGASFLCIRIFGWLRTQQHTVQTVVHYDRRRLRSSTAFAPPRARQAWRCGTPCSTRVSTSRPPRLPPARELA